MKQLSKDDLDSGDKSTNLSLHDNKSDISVEEKTPPRVFTLDDITEGDINLTR